MAMRILHQQKDKNKEDKQNNLNAVISSINIAKGELGNVNDEKKQTLIEIGEYKVLSSIHKKELDSINERLLSKKEEEAVLDKKIADVQRKLSESEGNLSLFKQNTEKESSNFVNKIESLQENHDALERNFNEKSLSLSNELSLINNSILDKTVELKSVSDKFNSIQASVEEKENYLTLLERKINDRESDLGSKEQLSSSLDKNIAEKVAKLDVIQSNLRSTNENYAQIDGAIKQKSQELVSLKKELEDTKLSKLDILSREEKVNQKANEIIELGNRIGVKIKL